MIDNNAINKAMWSQDGTKLLTGNSSGNVKVHGLHKSVNKNF
jgi:hypothetical protein